MVWCCPVSNLWLLAALKNCCQIWIFKMKDGCDYTSQIGVHFGFGSVVICDLKVCLFWHGCVTFKLFRLTGHVVLWTCVINSFIWQTNCWDQKSQLIALFSIISYESVLFTFCSCKLAFRVLTLFVGRQESIWSIKNWVMRCCCGYLSGAKCKWFACGPANATATPPSLASLKSKMFLPFWYRLTQVVLEKRP